MLFWSGDFLGAIPHIRRALAIDSTGPPSDSPCRSCDAYGLLSEAYALADSLPTAEQVAREWIRQQPQSRAAWDKLAGDLERQGRYEKSLAAVRNAAALGLPGEAWRLCQLMLRQGDFDRVEQLFEQQLPQAPPVVRGDWLWNHTISLRYQGRLRAALQEAVELRRIAPVYNPAQLGHVPYEAIAQAQVLHDMGRAPAAAALWDSLAQDVLLWQTSVGARARNLVWYLTHEADALAVAGDTARQRVLADSVERLGQLSAFGRDRRLHHHVRGLLLRLQGRPLEAAAEFRAALFSPYFFTRTNLELGRSLLAADRPGEAIPMLRAGVRGPVEIWGMYATGTEFHELLARAFEARGQPDSAAVHYRWVLNAWAHADPEFEARREALRVRLAALTSPKFLTARPLR